MIRYIDLHVNMLYMPFIWEDVRDRDNIFSEYVMPTLKSYERREYIYFEVV